MRKAEKEQIRLKVANGSKKPPLKTERITLDDFKVDVDGQEYFPHLDEFVEILPIRRLDELRNLMELASYTADGENISITDPRLMKQYEGLCKYLSDCIFKWNVTDEENNLLPMPYKRPDIIEKLTVEEINYFVAKLIGGRTDDSKNDSPPSPVT